MYSTQRTGSYVVLTVSDTGVGMDAATQARIFDPFFTTKEVGKGTGLGLSTVYGVVKQSGGFVSVYSEPGHGATFKIYFPRVGVTPEIHKSRLDLLENLCGTETILLVEDEEALRELARQILVKHGYKVISAETPLRALQIASGPADLDLLLTDVVMPGIHGSELAKLLAQNRPEMKVIYMSGYTGSSHAGLLEPAATLMSKPLRRDTLLRTVREVLDSRLVAKPV